MRIQNRSSLIFTMSVLLILGFNCENPESPDTISPSIDLISPSDGSTVFEITPIKVNVSDNVGIDRVEYYIGAQLIGTIPNEPFTYYWNTTTIEDGSIRTIQCRAYDTSDNEAISPSITVTINNEGRDPTPVSLPYQTVRYKYKVDLTWTKSIDLDYNQYLIQKADSITSNNIWDCIDYNNWPDYSFDESCVNTWSIIHAVYSSTDTTFSDTSVTLANYYVYKVTVLDSADLSSDSNIRYFSTRNVESLPITDLHINNELSVEVQWQQSSEDDFLKYELYRYVENDSLLLLTTHNVTNNSYTDENTTEFVSYSYFIRHYDKKSNFADGTSESISIHLSPATLEVPTVIFPSIQSALNAAEPTDIVLVNDGIYNEYIVFPEKNNVKLKSRNGPLFTIIDANRSGRVVTVEGFAHDSTSSIEGFTIQGGGYLEWNPPNTNRPYNSTKGGGIGVYDGAEILIKNNIIKNNYNSDGGGGGIYTYESSPVIVNNRFNNNIAGISPNGQYSGNWFGGAICIYYGEPTIMNCTFNNNKAEHWGGALYIYGSDNISIVNCTFINNELIGNYTRGSVLESNGHNNEQFSIILINNIFWDTNTDPFSNYYGGVTIEMSYSDYDISDSDVEYQQGNITIDPSLVDETELRLNNNSPCIDSGNPNSQHNDFDGSRNDMGAYGGPSGDW